VRVLWAVDANTLTAHVFEQPGIDGYRITKTVNLAEVLTLDFAPELAVGLLELTFIEA
jgi:hypothetical protein